MGNCQLKKFGHRLRSIRESKGFSQEAFANLLDVDRSYLGGIERGERNPSLKIVYRICEAIEIKPEELFK